MSESTHFPTALTVAELKDRLIGVPDGAHVCACSDRTHAACDVVTDVYVESSVVSLATHHPSNINNDYPFREPKIAAIIEATKRLCEVVEVEPPELINPEIQSLAKAALDLALTIHDWRIPQ